MIDRRTFIGGGLGMLAGTTLSPRLLAAPAAAPYMLLVYASGGWDPTMVFDDKRGSSYVTRESGARQGLTGGGLRYVDHPSRPSVKAFFDSYGSKAAIINGLSTGSMGRIGALENMWGITPPNKNRPVDWLSYYVASLNPVFDIPHAVIDSPYMPGDYTGVAVRLSKRTIAERLGAIPQTEALGTAGEKALKELRAAAYGDAAKEVSSESLDGEKIRSLYYGFAREPLIKSRLRTADEALGPQGSDSDFVHQGKLAIELFASGASFCATVQAGATDQWDTRSQNFTLQSANYEDLFSGLSTILDFAQTRGIAEKLTVVVLSERGRAPRLNDQGGKAPWPVTSAMLWGAGVRGNTVISASDGALRALPVSPLFGSQTSGTGVTLTVAHMFSALYLRFGVPYKLAMPTVQPLTPILSGAT